MAQKKNANKYDNDDYRRNDPQERPPKKKKGGAGFYIIIFICLAVLAFSVYNLARIFMEYQAGDIEYDDLRQYTSNRSASDRDDRDSSSGSTSSSAANLPSVPIDVDFNELSEINRDIVGWIYIGAADISYPIVQGTDNNEYLHTTFEKQNNAAGSIFMEYRNASDFSDPNTIVYGHNMRNGSMFGKLHRLDEADTVNADPYFWILTPEGDYCYRIFSVYSTAVDSDVYTLFDGAGDSFVSWAQKCQSNSDVALQQFTFDTKNQIVTLSTCTGRDTTRFVVQGIRVK